MRIVRRFPLWLCVLLPGCVLYSNRGAANNVVHELENVIAARESNTVLLASQMVKQCLAQVRERTVAGFGARIATLRVEVYRRIEDQRRLIHKRTQQDLRKALEPVLQRIDTELNQAKATPGDGMPRLREYMLAAQQASTMAVAHQELEQILSDADAELDKLRQTVLDELETKQKIPLVVPSAEADAEAFAAQLGLQSKGFLRDVDEAFSQLDRYFAASDAPGLFFRGATKELGWNLDGLQSRVDNLLSQGQTQINSWLSDNTDKLLSGIDTKVGDLIIRLTGK